jgi:hypothetical protein
MAFLLVFIVLADGSLLRLWGGEWMWEELEVIGSLEDVVSAIQSGKAIWCTDGSFDRLAQPDSLSAGWVIFDPETKHHIRGSFYEVSADPRQDPIVGNY